MKAIITVDVPEHQIGQEVSVYFKDTMCIKGTCESETEVYAKHDEEIIKETVASVWGKPCEDAVSRQAVLDLAKFDGRDGLGTIIHAFDVEQLPPVNPQNNVLDKIASEIEEQVKLVESMGCPAKQFRIAWGIVNQYRGE